MRRPWTLRLIALGSARQAAYSSGRWPRFWTRRGAAKQARRLNAEMTHHMNYLWMPALTKREPW